MRTRGAARVGDVPDNRLDDAGHSRELVAARERLRAPFDPVMGPAAINIIARRGVSTPESVGKRTADTMLAVALVQCDACMVKDGTPPGVVAGLLQVNTCISPTRDCLVGYFANFPTKWPTSMKREICKLPATEGMKQWLDNQAATHRLAPTFFFVIKTVRTKRAEAGHTDRSEDELAAAVAADIVDALVAARAPVEVFRPGAVALLGELCCANQNGAPSPTRFTSKITSLVVANAPRALADAPAASALRKKTVAAPLVGTIDARDVPKKLADLGVKGTQAHVDLLRTQRSDGTPFNALKDAPVLVLTLAAAGKFKDADAGAYKDVEFGIDEVGNGFKLGMRIAGHGHKFRLGYCPTLEAAKALRKVLLGLPHVLALLALLHCAGAAPDGDRVRALAQAEADLGLPPLTGRLLAWGVARLEADPAKRDSFVDDLQPARVHARARMAAALPRDHFIVVHRQEFGKHVNKFKQATGLKECPCCEEMSEFVGATDGKGDKSEVDGPGGMVDACLECSFYYKHPEVKRTAEKAQDMLAAKRARKRAGLPPVIAPDPEFGFTRSARHVPRPA